MSGKLILIIEDAKDLARQMEMRLKAHGYRVETAEDGDAGLRKARDLRPDLILLDLMLPKIDGYRVCRLLKFDKEFEEIPVIIVSARSLEEDKELAAETGANAYFVKPVDWEELSHTIAALLQRRREADSAPAAVADK